MPSPDVLIIGAGVVGCSIARVLALRGADVLLLDGGRPGTGASWAAAGLLSPHLVGLTGDTRRAGLELCRRSFEGYEGLAEALQGETGIDIQQGTAGILEVARTEQEAVVLQERLEARRVAAMGGQWLSRAEVRELEPGISEDVEGGAHHVGEGQLDNRLLCRALALSARRAGARIEIGAPVSSLWLESSLLQGVIVNGERRAAARVVVAAGCGSPTLVPPGRKPLPVEPVRGQMLGLEGAEGVLRRPVLGQSGYLVPRRDGRVLAGSTLEYGVDARTPTLAGVLTIAGMAVSLVPALARCRFDTAWAGLRPCTPDWLPILGVDPTHPQLLWATGHGPNGVLLAPVTAEWVGSLVDGGPPPLDPEPFAVERFLGGSGPQRRAGTAGPPVA